MADFGEFESSEDPTADFLAREKELLGDDAALFESAVGGGGSGSGATIEDDFGDFTEDKGTSALTDAAAAFPPAPVVSSSPGMPDSSFGRSGSPAPQQSYPPASPVPTQNTGASAKYEDSEFIQQWRQKQTALLEERDRASESKHAEILEKAKKDLENFYKDYNEKKDKMKQQAAKEQGEAAKSQGAVSGDNVWDRVVALADLPASQISGSPTASSAPPLRVKGGKDTSRMRQVLTQLKNDPTAPLSK